VRELSYVTYFLILGPLYISGMDKVRDFEYGARIDRQAYKPKMQNLVKRGLACVTWPTFIIVGPPLFLSNV